VLLPFGDIAVRLKRIYVVVVRDADNVAFDHDIPSVARGMGKFAVPAPPLDNLRVERPKPDLAAWCDQHDVPLLFLHGDPSTRKPDVLDRNGGASLEQLVGSASLRFGSCIAV
jgi:hypothetical protein